MPLNLLILHNVLIDKLLTQNLIGVHMIFQFLITVKGLVNKINVAWRNVD